MADNDVEWPITPAHADLIKKYPELSKDEKMCLAVHEVAYSLRGLAYEQNQAANVIADAVFSLSDQDEYEEEETEEEENQGKRRH